ncbi:MAG: stage II sporulation protein M [Bacilli bacterium]|nr:stage II sporulation protein M [Bacilli bacterium]
MNKKLNSGLAIILPDKKVNLFVLFIIFLGIVSGTIFLVVLNETDNKLVVDQITNFMNNINDNNINNVIAFKNSITENGIFILITWILGMSIIGIIFNIFFMYIKGFMIGFSISSFFLVYKYKGLLAAFIYLFPSSIINIIVTLMIGVYSVLFTINLWKIIFMRDKNVNMKKFLKKYFFILIISIILCLISSLMESYLVPAIMKLFIKVFV